MYRVLVFWIGLMLLVFQGMIKAEPLENEPYGRVVYDQRQNGKYNIHVNIKDVAIIEMSENEFEDESFNEEDYYYDEGDLTVKPLPSWITKPANQTTTKPLIHSMQNNVTNRSTLIPIPTQKPSTPIIIPISEKRSTSKPSTYSANVHHNIAASEETTPASTSSTISAYNDSTSRSSSITTPSKPFSAALTSDFRYLATDTSIVQNFNGTVPPPAIVLAKQSARSNDVPAQVVFEPVLHPKQRHNHFPKFVKRPTVQTSINSDEEDDSTIYKFKVRRPNKEATVSATPAYPMPYRAYYYGQRRCRSGHFRDESGACRIKRSSSILKKLFNMLVSLPLGASETADDGTF